MKKNMINWFEIPVVDMKRAQVFYENIFDIRLVLQDFGNFQMAYFPGVEDEDVVTGALCKLEGAYTPSQQGALLYLNANPDLSVVLQKVEEAGGKIQSPKKQISPEYGFMALIIDTEGNRIALHSQS